MGIIRGTIITIISIVLLISLFLMSFSLTLNWSLNYETLKPELKNSVKEILTDEFDLNSYVNTELSVMQTHCENSSEFVFNKGGQTFVLPCEKVREGPNAILNYSLDNLIEQVYYKEYDCKFLECIKETDTMLVLVSKQSKDFWNSKFYIFLLTSLALSTLIFFISKNKGTTFIITGGLMIISSLPLTKIKWLLTKLPIPNEFQNLALIFFSKSTNVFLTMLILGIILILFGVSLYFFNWGQKIAEWFSKNKDNISKDDVKEIVKEESKKSKN